MMVAANLCRESQSMFFCVLLCFIQSFKKPRSAVGIPVRF